MDISFMTNAGGENNWSLEECARWAKTNDFDCVRLGDSGGATDSDKILTEGPDEVLDTLKKHDLYLACLTAHHNLLDDDEKVAQQEQERLLLSLIHISEPTRPY